MNKIFRGTLEVKTEVLDQNAISDSSDPLKEVARHVSTPSLALTKINGNNQSLSVLQLQKREAGPNQPNPTKSHIYKDSGENRSFKIPEEYRVPFLEYRFLIPKLTDNVTIYWTELADLRGWRSGVLPNEQPGLNWSEYDGRNPGIL